MKRNRQNRPSIATLAASTTGISREQQHDVIGHIQQGADFSTDATAYLNQWPLYATDGVLRIEYKETFASKGDCTLDAILEASRQASRLGVPTFVDITVLDPNDHFGFVARTGLLRFDSLSMEDITGQAGNEVVDYAKERTEYNLPLGFSFRGPQPEDLIGNCDRLSDNQEAFLLELIRVDSKLNQLRGVVCNTRFAKQTSPLLRVVGGPILEGRYPLKQGSGVTSCLWLYPGSERYRECAQELAWCGQGDVASSRSFKEFKSSIDHSWIDRRRQFVRVMFSPAQEFVDKRELIELALESALVSRETSVESIQRAAQDFRWWNPS